MGFEYHYIFLRVSDNTTNWGVKSGIKKVLEEEVVGVSRKEVFSDVLIWKGDGMLIQEERWGRGLVLQSYNWSARRVSSCPLCHPLCLAQDLELGRHPVKIWINAWITSGWKLRVQEVDEARPRGTWIGITFGRVGGLPCSAELGVRTRSAGSPVNFICLLLAVLGLHCRMGFLFCCKPGLLSDCSAWASHCSSFSCCRVYAIGYRGFNICNMWNSCNSFSSWALEHRLSSCTWA